MSIRSALLAASVFLLASSADAWAQQREIAGQVVSAETGQPVAGATVLVKNTAIGAITDADGSFRLFAPARDVTLVVRFLGFKSAEVPVAADERTVNVQLEVDVLRLEELVVTGRATEISRRNLPNAISTISGADLDRAPSETMEKAIQGKVPGAIIETNSGAPGGGVQVRLRGVSTINALSEPLYVVDGVLISNVAIPSNQNAVTAASGGSNPALTQDAQVNRVADLNPEEIERIEILKGASAAAIYGAKASNGVVVITTKRGRPGAARWSFSQRFGTFDLSEKLGFRTYETEDEALATFAGSAADTAFIQSVYTGQFFDQEELLAGRSELSTETSLSVSGGDDDTRYYIAGLWKEDEGIIANSGFSKQSVRLNLDQRFSERWDVGLSTNLIHSVAQRSLTNNDNSGTSFYMTWPATPNFVNLQPDASGVFPENPFANSNPLQTAAMMRNDEDVWRFILGGRASFEAVRTESHSLQLLGNAGVDYFSQENDLFFPPELQFEPLDGFPGTALLSNSNNLNLNISGNAVYTYRSPTGVRATTSAGVQYEEQDLTVARIVARNISGGLEQIDAGTNIGVRQERSRIKDAGFYLQEEVLMMDERLLLTAGARFDASSTNGDDGKYFFYPKAAGSYRIPEVTDFLDELKFRLAWGQSGNRPLFGQKFTPIGADRNIEGLPALVVVGRVGAPDLEPERQNEVEGGIDATLLDGRASLEFTVYQKNISDLLLERELAPSTGFTTQIFNGGKLRVRGVEAAFAATPIQNELVTWLSRTTFSTTRSKVTDLPVPAFRTGGFGTSLGAYEIAEGQSATQIVTNLGLDSLGNVVTGPVGDGIPDFKMAFSNDIRIGRFNVFSLWDWQQGGTVINLTRLLFDDGGNSADFDVNVRTDTIDYVPGDLDSRLIVSGGEGLRRLLRFANGDSRGYMEDATYLKLRELSVSYEVPANFITNALGNRVQSVRLTLSGRNLLTFTDYTGLDPEVSNFGNQPIARNIDVAPFPPSRSFWFSVDVGF